MNKRKKVALVTGGISGIGESISVCLKKNDYKVIANYPPGRQSDAKLFKDKHDIDVIEFDASDYNATKTAFNHMSSKHGQIDILINNAGITRDRFHHKMSYQDWQDVININLNSVFNCSRQVIESMRKNNYGRIINISSVNALKGQIGQTNYCASKAAIIGFSKALAQESASKGITVNVIAPGYVDTEMTKKIDPTIVSNQILPMIPLNRFASPSEISSLVLYLVSDDASYMTGQTISINGGLVM